MYKFTITYTCKIEIPVGTDMIKRTAIVYGITVNEAINKLEALDSDYFCAETIISEETDIPTARKSMPAMFKNFI